MKTPAQGAATSIHLASAPDLEQVTGRYFANSKPKSSAERSYDEAAAARLWQVSADLVGLTRRTMHPTASHTTSSHHHEQPQRAATHDPRHRSIVMISTTQTLRRASLTAGIGLALMAVLAAFGVFGAVSALITPGDPATTALDIAASPRCSDSASPA